MPAWQNLRITAEQVEHYCAADSNIGLLLGEVSDGLVCIDLDCDVAVELAEQFLPPTGLVAGRTARPRTHHFFRVVGELKNRSFKLPGKGGKPTVEILSTGKQVVVGPSIHPSGDTYDVLGDGEPATANAAELFEAVETLHAATLVRLGLSESSPPERQPERQPNSNAAGLRPGDDFNERGDVRELLQRHGWQLVSGGANEHWRRPGKDVGTSATLKDGNKFYVFSSAASPFESNRCYDPLGVFVMLEHDGDFSAAAVALRAAGYGDSVSSVDVSSLVAQLPQPDEFDDDDDTLPDNPTDFPEDCLRPPGLIGDIVDYCLKTARYPQTRFAFAAALSLMATITGRKIRDRMDTRTNLYILCLAKSTAGKEHPSSVNTKVFLSAGCTGMAGPQRIISATGIVNRVAKTPAVLFQADEIGALFETIREGGFKNPHTANITSVMLHLFSSSNSPMWTGDSYADTSKTAEIVFPHFCILGTTTPAGFWPALDSKNLCVGLLGRFLVIEGQEEDNGFVRRQRFELSDVPPSIVERAKAWAALPAAEGYIAPGGHPDAAFVEHTPEAYLRTEQYADSIDAKKMAEDDTRAAIWGRAGEKANKLALLFAASRWDGVSKEFPPIELADVNRAIRLVNWLTQRMLFQAHAFVARNAFEASVKDVLRLLGGNGLSLRELGRKTSNLRKRDRDEIIAHLLATREIEQASVPTQGRPKTVLRCRKKARP